MKLDVTSIRLVKNPESSRKAYASVVVEDAIVLNDIVVVEGKNGLFTSMPQRKYTEGGEDKYANIFNPITKEARDELVGAVLAAYEKALEDAESES